MPSRFEELFQSVAVPSLNREFGVTVRFLRGVYVSEEFTARRNDRVYRAIGTDAGIEVDVTMRDFVLAVADLLIDGDAVEQRTGDRISEGDEVFEIQSPNESLPSVELQSGGYEWIVHTKRVS